MTASTVRPRTPRKHTAVLAYGVGGALLLFVLLWALNTFPGQAGAAPKPDPGARPPAAKPADPSAASTALDPTPNVEVRAFADASGPVASGGDALRGQLFDAAGDPIAGCRYWVVWGHQEIDADADLGEFTAPDPAARRTDRLGAFGIGLAEPRHGMLWFEAPAGLRAACLINAATLRSRNWMNVRLPATARVDVHGIDVPPDSRFRVHVFPATAVAVGWDTSEIEVWPAHFWRRNEALVDVLCTRSFLSQEFPGAVGHLRVLAGRPYEFDVQGAEYAVRDAPRGAAIVRAPGRLTFHAGAATPHGMVVVRDRDGRAPTRMPGRVITAPLPDGGRWREAAPLESGRCRIGYRMLQADTRHRLWVLLASGEWFERDVRTDGAARLPTISLSRAESNEPHLVPLDIGVTGASDKLLVFAEVRSGALVRGESWRRFDMPDDPSRFAFVVHRDAIGLIPRPAEFERLFVLEPDGRLARGENTAAWLPHEKLPPVDLAEAYRRHGQRRGARIEFELEIVTRGDRRTWITLDRYRMGPKLRWFPVWRKVAPRGMRARFTIRADGDAPIELTPGR